MSLACKSLSFKDLPRMGLSSFTQFSSVFFLDFTHSSTSFVRMFQSPPSVPPFLLTNCSSYTLALKSVCAALLITATVSEDFPTPTLREQWTHAAAPSTFSSQWRRKTPTKTSLSAVSRCEREHLAAETIYRIHFFPDVCLYWSICLQLLFPMRFSKKWLRLSREKGL